MKAQKLYDKLLKIITRDSDSSKLEVVIRCRGMCFSLSNIQLGVPYSIDGKDNNKLVIVLSQGF